MAIIIILILGLFLRLINLNQSLWLDEAVSVLLARDLSPSALIGHFRSADFHPPLHYLWLHFWSKIFGWSEISARMPSVLFGIGTIWVVYLLGKEAWRDKFSISRVMAFLLAIAPFHIYYSQEARPYAMATFLATLSMYFFIKIAKNQEKVALDYLVATTALLYTDYYGFLILLAQAVALLFLKKYRWLVLCSLPVFLFLPWLPILIFQLKIGQSAVFLLPQWGNLVSVAFWKALPVTFIKFILGRITIFNKELYLVVAGAIFILYGRIIIRGVLSSRKSIIHNLLFILLLTWLFAPLFSAWLISAIIPNYQPFRLLLVLPAFYLLLAEGICRSKSLMNRFIELALVLSISLVSLGVYYFNPYFHREDWRGVVKYLEIQTTPSAVVLPSETSAWPWQYYSSGKISLLTVASEIRPIDQQDIENLDQKLLFQNQIYYIRYLVPLFDPEGKIELLLKKREFDKIKEISFNQISVWEYEKL